MASAIVPGPAFTKIVVTQLVDPKNTRDIHVGKN